MQNYWNVYHWMYKQQQLSRPVNYQDFRETGPRVSMTTKAAKETMHPWEWGCHWSTRMRFTWIKLPDSATSHNSFALKARACYRQSQTSHACRLNLSNMKCCFAEAKLKKDCNFPTIYPSTKRERSLLPARWYRQWKDKRKEDYFIFQSLKLQLLQYITLVYNSRIT